MSRGLTLFDTPFVASNVTDWATRVVNNGGAMPSAGTIAAMETFRLALISSGLYSKMKSVCVFVPDSLIAATTPLVVGIGSDPWTNNNFVGGDLNVEGLMGGGSRYLDTGVKAKAGEAYTSGNVGMTCVITETDGQATGTNVGYQDGTTHQLMLIVSGVFGVAGVTYFTTSGPSAGNHVKITDWNRCGYVSGNSISGTASVYTASPLRPHATLISGVATVTPTTTENTIYAFAVNDAGTPGGFRAERMSFVAIHDGLNSSESATFAGLIQTLRTALGGGTGDEVESWAARSVTLGGTAISSNTKDALRTFYQGLVSNSLLTKMVSVNCVVPDNLVAARLPLVWNDGLELWTNNNFVSGDLTVNGLIGNGSTKYLDTNIKPNTAPVITTTSAGITAVVSECPSSTDVILLGADDGFSSQRFALQKGGAGIYFFCWKWINAGADHVNALNPGSDTVWTGYISGNRTASNSLAIYVAKTSLSHTTLVSGSGAQTGNREQRPLYTHAFNNAGSAAGFSPLRVSFLAIHGGLDSSESAILYGLVAAMRNAIGGGNP